LNAVLHLLGLERAAAPAALRARARRRRERPFRAPDRRRPRSQPPARRPPPQVRASAQSLRLVTFDADGTLYADGHHIEQDSEMIRLFVSLMRLGVHGGEGGLRGARRWG
jgi:hypothetical protein